MKTKRKICVIDAETDPFNHGDQIYPFCWGFYDGEIYIKFWGENCTIELIEYLQTRKDELLIYAHNGGKFDFFYLIDWCSSPIKIINGRIVSVRIAHHELRDSFSIIPVSLAAYQKDAIDYSKFTRMAREKNKAEILRYLESDCFYLYTLVIGFADRFGSKLTIGSVAITEISKFHPFQRQNETHDIKFRAWYFGGRCECFDAGDLRGDWKVYDVNSMYPFVMRDRNHLSGKNYVSVNNANDRLDRNGYFTHDKTRPYLARIIADSRGALPYRHTDKSLVFPYGINEYHATSHEIQTAIKNDLLKIISVEELHVCLEPINFSVFVDTYYRERIAAKKSGDRISELFSKFLLNSGYGKFGTNPANFSEWHIRQTGDPHPGWDWILHSEIGTVEIYSKPTPAERWSYFDVATAASITGAARAVLLNAIPKSSRLIYCDTDSIIAENLGSDSSDTDLGGWKLEARADTALITGKKQYALYNQNGSPIDGKNTVKIASKGIKATLKDMQRIARGEIVRYDNPAPSFSLTRGVRYISREVKFNARIENHVQV